MEIPNTNMVEMTLVRMKNAMSLALMTLGTLTGQRLEVVGEIDVRQPAVEHDPEEPDHFRLEHAVEADRDLEPVVHIPGGEETRKSNGAT